MTKLFLVYLSYDIMFDDADNGESWAGDGKHDLKLFDSEAKAQDFISEYQEVFKSAFFENRRQVFPRLPNQQKLQDDFGIDLCDICSDMDDPKLNYKVMKVE